MELNNLIARAMEVREKYSALEKEKYGREWTRAELMEGFVGDVGDLMKIVMAKEGIRAGEDIDAKLEHELADCLWSILVLSKKFNIDLESSFLKTMDQLDERIAREM